MKKVTILGGSINKDTGNLRATTSQGYVHVHQKALEAAGIAKGQSPKFPCYAIVDFDAIIDLVQKNDDGTNKTTPDGKLIPLLDAAGVQQKQKRPTAILFYTKLEELAAAQVADRMLDITVDKAIKEAYAAAGLTPAEVSALLADAVGA